VSPPYLVYFVMHKTAKRLKFMGLLNLYREFVNFIRERESSTGKEERLKLEQERREYDKHLYEQQIKELQDKCSSLTELLDSAHNQIRAQQKENDGLEAKNREQAAEAQELKETIDRMRKSQAKPPRKPVSGRVA